MATTNMTDYTRIATLSTVNYDVTYRPFRSTSGWLLQSSTVSSPLSTESSNSSAIALSSDSRLALNWFVGVALVAVLASVIVSALVGNCLVIVGIWRFRRLRTVANSFLVSLAVADLLVAVLVMPFSAVQLVAGRWPFGRLTCDLFNANDVLFSTASLLHLCCVSVDRYVAVTDPFGYDRKMSRRRVGVMLVVVWTASALLSHVPIHLGWYSTSQQQQQLDVAITTTTTDFVVTDAHTMSVDNDYYNFRWHTDSDDENVATNRKWTNFVDSSLSEDEVASGDECSFEVNRVYVFVSSGISFWVPATVMLFAYVKIFREAQRQERRIRAMRCTIPSPSPASVSAIQATDNRRSTITTPSGAVDKNPSPTGRRATAPIRSSDVAGPPSSLLPTGYCRRLSRRLQTDNKAARTLGIIMGAFIVCWLPFFTWYVASTLCGATGGGDEVAGLCEVSTRPELIATLFWVGYANSALNPFIYAAFNRDFRQAFHSLLSSVVCAMCCWAQRGAQVPDACRRQRHTQAAAAMTSSNAVLTSLRTSLYNDLPTETIGENTY